jgi:PadR family transcriptional regulator, regulatory protein AphA
MSSLTPTARVILGMLKLGVHTGYEIKKAIDISTRFFWGASFGQIYPELRRLRDAGLIEGRDVPRGQVKRTVYSLTPAGEVALHEWLTDTESFTFEMRDEGLLRLFFGDALSRDEVVANLRASQGFLELVLSSLREIEADARTGFAAEEQLHPYLALQYGIGLITWMRDWYAKTEEQLASGKPLVELDHDEPAGRERRLGPAR